MKESKMKKKEMIAIYSRLALILLCLTITWPISNAMAGDFYSDSQRGWFWFETGEKNKDKEEAQDLQELSTPLDALREFQERIETAKAFMIMTPSISNTKAYIQLQNEMFLKASNVMKNWHTALLLYPELNIVKDLPISQVGANITREIDEAKTQNSLKAFAKKYQLLFFYRSDCSYCHKFALVLNHFRTKYHARVVSIALDGKKLDGFPGMRDDELTRKLGVTFTPSLFAFSSSSKVVFPIAHGFLPIDLFERNILLAINQIEHKTNNGHKND